MKGQSAIEYLMTYGWMLLVVAIVGGAIFAMVQGEVVESISGFTGGDIQVDNFGVTSNDNLQLDLRNGAGDSIQVKEINVTDDDGRYTELLAEKSISVGDSDTMTLAGVQNSNSANTLDVDITYDVGALENMQVSGTVSGGLELINDSRTLGDSLEVDHFERAGVDDDGSYTFTNGADDPESFNITSDDDDVFFEAREGSNILRVNDVVERARIYSLNGDGRPNYPSTNDTYSMWFGFDDTELSTTLRFHYNMEDTSNYNDIRIKVDVTENEDSVELHQVIGGDSTELHVEDGLEFNSEEEYRMEIKPEEDSQEVRIYTESGNLFASLDLDSNEVSEYSGFALRSWSDSDNITTYITGLVLDNTID